MPWTAADAAGHTKKARSPTAQRQWSHISNGELASGKSEGEAIRIANGVLKKRAAKTKLRRVTA